MPPKKKGGRGESAANSPSAESQPQVPPSSEDAKPNIEQLNADSSQVELPSDPLAAAPQPQPDPISVNTTPAPSARSTPSVQQLDSNQATPAPSSATRGKRTVTAPRGAGRRSQAKRDELQKADDERRRLEAQQRAQEDAAKAKQQGRWGGGRGRGRGEFRDGRGRGRGGYVGDSERRKQDAVASGPFSSGEIHKDKRGSGNWRTSGGISRGAQVGLHASRRPSQQAEAGAEGSGTFTTGIAGPKRSARTTTGLVTGGGSRSRAADGTPVKPDPDSKPALDADGDISMSGPVDGGFISSDEEADEKENARRFNIENLIDLTGEDDEYDPMTPVRLMRVAHKERTMGINADGATGKDGSITVSANDAATRTKRKGKQKGKEEPQPQDVSSGSDRDVDPTADTTIKPDPEAPGAAEERLQEPQLAGGASNLDDLPLDPPSSPESKRKGKEKIKARALSNTSEPERPDLQTQEEIDEWERNQHDLRILRNELGSPAPTAPAEGETETEPDKRADKVYLFQFPPVLPDLAPLSIKPDPDGPATDAMEVDRNGAVNSKENPIDVADTATNQPRLPSGLVGKLNIHKSGRATLDWGGTSFCLGMGAEASFLQDILVAEVPDSKEGDEPMDGGVGSSGREGVALSMGQVKGKFVVTPDWDEILG